METTRVRYFLDLLVDKKKAIMFVGAAGTGKSVIVNDKLKSLPNDLYAVANVSLNFYTTSGDKINVLLLLLACMYFRTFARGNFIVEKYIKVNLYVVLFRCLPNIII